MTIIRTIDLSDDDRKAICKVLKITDMISNVTDCSMDEVFGYFVSQAEKLADGSYSIIAMHEIDDIG